jgi:hypothetical protein
LRFFGLNPSRRASFSSAGEGSEEAAVSELAGFEAVAVESVPAAAVAGAAGAGAVAEEEAVDEAGVADEAGLVAGVSDAGDCAPHCAAATSMSDARRAMR